MATKINVEKRLADLEGTLSKRSKPGAITIIEVWGDCPDNPRLLEKYIWNGSEFEVQNDGPEQAN